MAGGHRAITSGWVIELLQVAGGHRAITSGWVIELLQVAGS